MVMIIKNFKKFKVSNFKIKRSPFISSDVIVDVIVGRRWLVATGIRRRVVRLRIVRLRIVRLWIVRLRVIWLWIVWLWVVRLRIVRLWANWLRLYPVGCSVRIRLVRSRVRVVASFTCGNEMQTVFMVNCKLRIGRSIDVFKRQDQLQFDHQLVIVFKRF